MLKLITVPPSYHHGTFHHQMAREENIVQLRAIQVGECSFSDGHQVINVFRRVLVLQGLDGVEESQVQDIEVWTVWWLIRQLHPNAVVLHSLHNNTISPSDVWLRMILLDNATLRSGRPLLFDCRYHFSTKIFVLSTRLMLVIHFVSIVPVGRFFLACSVAS